MKRNPRQRTEFGQPAVFGLHPIAVAAALIGSAVVGGVVSSNAANKAEDAANNASAVQQQLGDKNLDLANRQQDLIEKQYDRSTKLYDEFAPMLKQQIQLSVDQQAKSIAQGDQQWASYQRDFAPLESKLAANAANFDTPQRRDQAAGTAVGGVSNAFDIARAGTRRSLADAGVRVGSGTSTALDAQSRIEQAKASALAGSNARTQVETQGLALLDNAARFGRNMPSTGIQTAALAGTQGQQAQGAYGTVANAQAAPTGAAVGGLGSVANTNTGAANLYLNAFSTKQAGIAGQQAVGADILGAAGQGLGAYYGFTSSKKKKHMKGKVDGLAAAKAVEKSGSEHWAYKDGEGDGNTKDRMGPTAESLAAVAPSVSDGKTVDGIAMLGLHHAAIGNTSKRLDRIEKKIDRLSLADAKPHKKAA